ncbi:helix-turn-helix transcriptional regulator [Blautia sp. RD014234]|nr:helix-turn-helix transcriptional regulator [Blautia parvula]
MLQKETGMTPHSYLTSIRLQQAVYYLKTTNRTIKDIAYACGFQSENSFCITFKKQIGYTPSEYRCLTH